MTPKRHFIVQKHAFWALIGRDQSYGVIWTQHKEYKKTKSKPKFPFSQTPFPSSHIKQILHTGLYSGYLSWFWVSLRSVEKCGSCGGSKFWPSHWLGTSLTQQLVAITQAMIWAICMLICGNCSVQLDPGVRMNKWVLCYCYKGVKWSTGHGQGQHGAIAVSLC